MAVRHQPLEMVPGGGAPRYALRVPLRRHRLRGGVSDENGIGRPEPGTLEALLTAAPGPGRFIPTHRGEGLPAGAIPTRSGSKKNPGYFPLTPQSLAEFDWLAVLDSTGYTRGGPPLQSPE